MSKNEEKQQAINQIAKLMDEYTNYFNSVKDEPFTPEVREQLRTRGEKIRWLQQGLESGYYDE
jgi:hypothetical protein